MIRVSKALSMWVTVYHNGNEPILLDSQCGSPLSDDPRAKTIHYVVNLTHNPPAGDGLHA